MVNHQIMYQFYYATAKNFDALLQISNEFEIYRQSSNAKNENIDTSLLLKNQKKYLKENLKEKHYRFYVCEKEKLIVGYIFFGQDEVYNDEGFIGELYIIPAERKKGIASQLLGEALEWIKRENCSQIELTVRANNKTAIHLYKKFGFLKQKETSIRLLKSI